MRPLLLTSIALLSLACTHHPASSTAERPIGHTITIGQSWPAATAVARHQGYDLQDASSLGMDPAPDGFTINLPAHQGLMVLRDPHSNTVQAINLIDNWPGPKKNRIHHPISSFDFKPPSH